jgi:hypothetical protein
MRNQQKDGTNEPPTEILLPVAALAGMSSKSSGLVEEATAAEKGWLKGLMEDFLEIPMTWMTLMFLRNQ